MQSQLVDKLNRHFDYLRISITDKCNFRCKYCMPKENFGRDYQFLKRDSLLTFEEIIRVVQILDPVGLKKIRLTGGEPLLRKNIENLVNKFQNDANSTHNSNEFRNAYYYRTKLTKWLYVHSSHFVSGSEYGQYNVQYYNYKYGTDFDTQMTN